MEEVGSQEGGAKLPASPYPMISFIPAVNDASTAGIIYP
jgi:hypothetical protein